MSLNGLDNPVVLEAYQCVLTEAGGWFLLQYVSRDEVALLDRGTGGVPEVRNAIDSYEESSPLYGFLQYRRRKVVLSYLPQGLSRLIQARTTVQFQSILDKFSPHDTVFTLSQPSDLSESALSSACLLHTASGSITSSSSSLRRRRLMEIAEDAEENTGPKEVAQMSSASNESRQRSFSQLSEATVVPPQHAVDTQLSSNGGETSAPTTTLESNPTNGRPPSIAEDRRSEYPASQKHFQEDYPASEPRKSTQSTRPSLRDLDRTSTYKQKVKLGPRPSVDGTGRPRTSGSTSRNAEQRPVASLPTGMRSSSLRKSNPIPVRPRSQGSTMASMSGMSSRTAPPVPPLLVPPLSMPISRPQLSPGAKSLSALSSSGTSNEKERLMKALKMRKTQMERKAREGKRNHQRIEEEGPQLDASENKENDYKNGTSDKHSNGGDYRTSDLEHGKTPLSETQPSVTPGHGGLCQEKENLITRSEPESVEVPATETDAHEHMDSDIPASDAGYMSTNIDQTTTMEQFQAAPIIAEPEIGAAQEDLALSVDTKAKSGPGSPSVVIDVPLADESLEAPEEEIAAAPTPPTEEPPVPSEQGDTTPQHELTPEISSPPEEKDINHRTGKRKPLLEPIQVPTPEYSDDDNLLSDDSFMEELTSATVEEAKPISVGRSPLSPGYSNNANDPAASDAWRNSRAVSNPSAIGHQMPTMHAVAVGRSVSTSYPETENSANPVLVAKKINVSSGISKRIKALEKFSNNAPPPVPSSLTTPSASSSFDTLRKRASVSLGTNSDAATLSRHGSYTPEAFSRASSVKRRDSQSNSSAKPTSRSVSVTARIIREPTPDSNVALSESNVLNLQPSPLTVEHEMSDTPLSQSLSVESAANKSEGRSLSTSSAGSGLPPRSESRLSLSSISRNDSTSSFKAAAETPSSPEERKESRTSRLLRRMSTITSHSRKNTVSTLSPVVKEEQNSPQQGAVSETAEAPQAVDIGEVNVQFPDTLLWKRRFVRVDDKGYLVLTPANMDSTHRNMVKRYHMTEFRTPCLPDEDRQEMPNSIMLDFFNGSTLQCACESRQGQAFVLQSKSHHKLQANK
ncbi:hypothetical protein FE257_001420 [Aspergillus nanangensis]|uniref:GPI-anchored cell surface glycoprotein n=1 Tax=Aspergillus nanangensis TaxID=2582783 RepID=A0AAD4CF07_ASPNN|nr:hypothetical protein FE257_001420 [Aspergillus nanangensis]